MGNFILRRNGWGETSTKHIKAAFDHDGIQLDIINKDKDAIPNPNDHGWCIRWATTSSIPSQMKVINKVSAMDVTSNKGGFRQIMADAGLAPKTVVNSLPSEDMYPVIIRPMRHSKSDDIYVAETVPQAKEAIRKLDQDYYCSEFIDKDRELRVYIVSGRVVCVREKIPEDKDEVSWGCVGSGTFEYVRWSHWPIDVVRKACAAFALSGLDFGAIDVIMKGKTAYILEINTGPHVHEYDGWQLGLGLMHIIKTGSRKLIPVGPGNDFFSFIHPAVDERAVLS